MSFPLLFIIAGTLTLIKGVYLTLAIWPIAYVVRFFIRPEVEIELTDQSHATLATLLNTDQ